MTGMLGCERGQGRAKNEDSHLRQRKAQNDHLAPRMQGLQPLGGHLLLGS